MLAFIVWYMYISVSKKVYVYICLHIITIYIRVYSGAMTMHVKYIVGAYISTNLAIINHEMMHKFNVNTTS